MSNQTMSNLQQTISNYCSGFKTKTIINVSGFYFDYDYEMGKFTHEDWMCRKYSFDSLTEAKEFTKTHIDELLEIPF